MDISPIVAATARKLNRQQIESIYQIYKNIEGFSGRDIEGNREDSEEMLRLILDKLVNGKRGNNFMGLILKLDVINNDAEEGFKCIQHIIDEEYEQAIYLLEKIRSVPHEWELKAQLMLINEARGSYSKAKEAFKRAIEISPNEIELRLYGAGMLYKNGDIKSAKKHYEFILQRDAKNYRVMQLCGEILSQTPYQKEAEEMLENYLIYAPISRPQGSHLEVAVNLLIISYIKKDLKKCGFMLRMIRNMIAKGCTKEISSETNRTFVRAFSRLIKMNLEAISRYSLVEENKKNIGLNDDDLIYHIGDSHCLAFSHQKINIGKQFVDIKPVIIKGAKAWHYCQKRNNNYKEALRMHIEKLNIGSKVLISFGEIDCRINEGILTYCKKYSCNIEETTIRTAMGYFDWAYSLLKTKKCEMYFMGIAAPTKDEHGRYDDKDEDARLKIIKLFNKTIKGKCIENGIKHIDTYVFTRRGDGYNNGRHMIDEFHLSPLAIGLINKLE